MKKLCLITLAVFTLATTMVKADAAANHVDATRSFTCSAKDIKAIDKSAKTYLDKNTAIHSKDILLQAMQCTDGYAKAKIHPLKPVTDDAVIYLKKTKNQWKVITLGTGIDADLLKTIPKALQESP